MATLKKPKALAAKRPPKALRMEPLSRAEKDRLILRAGTEATAHWLPLERLLATMKDLGPHSTLGERPLQIVRAKLRSLAAR